MCFALRNDFAETISKVRKGASLSIGYEIAQGITVGPVRRGGLQAMPPRLYTTNPGIKYQCVGSTGIADWVPSLAPHLGSQDDVASLALVCSTTAP